MRRLGNELTKREEVRKEKRDYIKLSDSAENQNNLRTKILFLWSGNEAVIGDFSGTTEK